MPEHTELEVDSVISRQNVAKEGWTTYYVDGTNGNDANNGLRWETAFKTIQHAIDEAESWAKIYIKSGTYAESVVIPAGKEGIALIGEKRDSVIIKPATESAAISIESDKATIETLTAIGNSNYSIYSGIVTPDAQMVTIRSCICGNQNAGGWGAFITGSHSLVKDVWIDQDNLCNGIFVAGEYNEVKKCLLLNAYMYALYIGGSVSSNCIVHDNHIENSGGYGIYLDKDQSYNTIFHNNIINSAIANAFDDSSPATSNWFENFYDDHSNIDNGFGIATEPYTFHGGSDPRPVVCRNGWLGLGVSGKIIKSATAAGTYTHPNDTDEHDVLEFTADTQDIFISLDVNALTQSTEIREYEKIDGATYRQLSCKTYPDDFDSGTKAITIYFKQKNKDYKVTLKSTVAEGASRSIPYVYRTDGKV